MEKGAAMRMFKNPAFWSVVFFLVALAQALGAWHSRLAAQVCTVCALALLVYAFVTWLRVSVDCPYNLRPPIIAINLSKMSRLPR
ncbi:hypothetical protein KY49_6240 [Burkholderia sp. MSHR3999]|nr:hypothetical protein KY49_6240 [Burkholderia sp. MSHR3999]